MKTTITNVKRLSTLLLAALAFAACSNENDDIAVQEPVQPVKGDITFTAVFAVKNPGTRALTDPGNGTLTASWEQGEQIAIVFGGNKYVAEVTEVDGAGNATVSATLPGGTPNNQTVRFIYPATAVDEYGTLNDLLSSQDGTLATLSSTLDVATADGTIVIDGTSAQPNGTVTLENKFAICKFQFKDESDEEITGIKKLTITDLATQDKYAVTMSTPQSAVYVAMLPSNNSTKFEMETTGGRLYSKTASAHLEAGMFYHPTLQVNTPQPQIYNLAEATGNIVLHYGDRATGKLGSPDYKVSIADGATVTLSDADINGNGAWRYGDYPGITCEGSATIILDGENSVRGFGPDYPGIFVPSGSDLVIRGDGSLTAYSGSDSDGIGEAAGIGAYSYYDEDVGGYVNAPCGNIEIQGGTITASGDETGIGSGGGSTCGNITISGGTVTASSWKGKPAIGHNCGNITITRGITSVSAQIYFGTCYIGSTNGSVTIDGETSFTFTTTTGQFSHLNSTLSTTYYDNDTWTLTKKLLY